MYAGSLLLIFSFCYFASNPFYLKKQIFFFRIFFLFYILFPLRQRSPIFLAPGTSFVEDSFFHGPGVGGWEVWGMWFQDDSSALHLLCTLFLLLLFHCDIQWNNYTAHHNAESWEPWACFHLPLTDRGFFFPFLFHYGLLQDIEYNSLCYTVGPCYLSIFLIDLYWSIVASQYCVSFCCTTKWISHVHTHVPISPPSWASLPSSLSHPSRSSQSTELISLCYAAASHQPTVLHSVVYICWCCSHFPPALPSHPMSSSPFSMSASLFLPCN